MTAPGPAASPIPPPAGDRGAAEPALAEEFILLGPAGSFPFEAAAIETELRAMWKSAASDGPTRGRAVYRAALANLAVPLDGAEHARITPVLAEVTRRYPSRLFLIERQPDPGRAPLLARVTALCHLRSAGGGIVCSEQIILQSGRGGEALLPSAIRSLLVGGLPFVLLDIGGEGSRAWAGDVQRDADLLLGDSALPGRLDRAAALWGAIAAGGTARVHDLAWARLTPWRELIAEQFDDTAAAASLSTLEEVSIGHGASPEGPAPPALLLAGWLAARLGWRPERRDGDALLLRGGHGPLRLSWEADPDGAPLHVSRVRLRAGAPHELDLEIAHPRHELRASLHARRPREERRFTAFRYRDFATCLVSELHRHEPNPTLEAAAHLALDLLATWRGAP